VYPCLQAVPEGPGASQKACEVVEEAAAEAGLIEADTARLVTVGPSFCQTSCNDGLTLPHILHAVEMLTMHADITLHSLSAPCLPSGFALLLYLALSKPASNWC